MRIPEAKLSRVVIISDELNGTALALSAPSGDANSDGNLDVGETWTYTASYTVTQADIDAGNDLVNQVSVITTEVPGPTANSATTPLSSTAGLTVEKNQTGGPNPVTAAGDVPEYTITVENTGSQTLTGIIISDELNGTALALSAPSGDANSDGNLDVGETWTYTASYTVTQADIDAGNDLVNQVSVITTEVPGPTANSATTPLSSTAGLTVEKNQTGGPNPVTAAGDVPEYTITVENTGSQTLTGIIISDELNGTALALSAPSGDANSDGNLDVGETWTYTASYTVTQADIDAGNDLVNQVSVITTEVPGPTANSATTPLSSTAGLTVEKNQTSGPNPVTAAGDVPEYTITVENTGSQTLTGIIISDELNGTALALSAPSGDANSDGNLDVGETWTYTASYTVTQADIDAGNDLVNQVSVITTEVPGPTANSATTPLSSTAGLTVKKNQTGGPNPVTAAGDVLEYTITVENTGSQTLTGVIISDELNGTALALSAPSGDANSDGNLDVGETWTYTISYIVTQQDINSENNLLNSAIVTTSEGATGTDNETVTVSRNSELKINKTASPTTYNAVGEEITYNIVVGNTGNVTLSNVSVTDPLTGLSSTIATLAPGGSETLTETYAVTQTDINSGSITNTVSVSGSDPGGETVTGSAEAVVTGSQNAGLSVTKTASPTTYNTVGEEITYTIVVGNTGNVSLSNVSVTDPLTGLSSTIATLAPGGSETLTETYAVTQTDINSGSITNTVSVSGSDPGGETVTGSAEAVVTGSQNAGLSVTKTASPTTYNTVGEEITYTIVVGNTGNVTLSNVSVTDPLTGLSSTIATLAPGGSETLTETYAVTQADINSGSITNTVSVSGSNPGGETVTGSAEAVVTGSQNAGLSVTKTASPTTYNTVGEEITYTIVVGNTGNVSLSNVSVIDPLTGLSSTIATLAPGGSETLTETYAVTQADINSGSITNTVSVSGSDPGGETVTGSAEAVVTGSQNAGLSVTKTASPTTYSNVGDEITYTIVVENTGNVTLTDIEVVDPLTGMNETVGSINPGASRNFSSSYAVTLQDLNERSVSNYVTVSGSYNNTTINDNAVATVTALLPPIANDDSSEDNVSGNSVVVPVLENDILNDGSQALPGLVSVDLNFSAEGIQSELIVVGEGRWNYSTQRGQLTFTPEIGFTADPLPFPYQLTEISTGLKDTAFVKIGYNQGEPFAFNDIITGVAPGDAANINVLVNDKLSDGSQALINLVTLDLDPVLPGVQLEIIVPGEGSWVLNPVTGDVLFTPLTGFTTDPTPLVYSLTEILTGISDNGTIIVGYEEVPPLALDDISYENTPGDTVIVNILENDELSDGTQAMTDWVSIDLNPSLPGVQEELVVSGVGKWNLNSSTAEVTFIPWPGFTGTTEPATYKLTENLTGLSNNAHIIIGYGAEPPFAAEDSSGGFSPGTAAEINILENDRLSDGTSATPQQVNIDLNLTEAGVQSGFVAEGQGSWLYVKENGILSFTPQPGFFDDPTPLTYRLCSVWNPSVCDDADVIIDYDQELTAISIGLVKTGLYNPADTAITYTFEVTNTGNTPVWDIVIVDELIGISNFSIMPDTLNPGASGTTAATYKVTQDDRDRGSVTNTAQALAKTYNGESVEDVSGITVQDDEPTITLLNQVASIAVEKEAVLFSFKAVLNEEVDFRINVTNDGNVILTEVLIEDPLTGFEQNLGQLLPGESVSYLTSYVVQPDDELNGIFENSAVARGTAPDESGVKDSSTVVVEVEQCEMVIPTGFSPNDDGIQDTWRIKCLEKYPDARIEIFNRWGNRVFEMKNYGNSDVHGTSDLWWDGYSSNKGTFGSSRLPAGTYYYILYLQEGREPVNGFIYLNR